MGIRKFRESDIEQIIDIWYESSLVAHAFIDKTYWRSQRQDMKEKYLPLSETYVISNDGDIAGFISLVDNDLAALFIDPKCQRKGYGQMLVHFAKEQREQLQLKVYSKNEQAIQFYLKNGFTAAETSIDDQTGEKEIIMEWKKN